MAVGARFHKGEFTIILSWGARFSEGQGVLNSQTGLDCFFCTRVISVVALLLIIHITMYILK